MSSFKASFKDERLGEGGAEPEGEIEPELDARLESSV